MKARASDGVKYAPRVSSTSRRMISLTDVDRSTAVLFNQSICSALKVIVAFGTVSPCELIADDPSSLSGV